ncbi:MAG: hypothetical protein ACQESF_00365 [Nanobdellota archaeon]
MYTKITEGETPLQVTKGKISKRLPVFYNPVMKLNRDLSILLINSIEMDDLIVGLPLAGTGARGIRLLKETKKGKIREVYFNDKNPEAIKIIKDNLELNYLEAKISQMDANEFLLQSKGFDYIDIDPFGTPNPFLDAAIKRLSRCGILAVTATDTSALCGTYKKVCRRNYWAEPTRTELMHEAGLRILIRKVQLIGAQYERALTPVFSYSKEHYMRVFFKSKKSKKKADDIIKQHSTIKDIEGNKAGPIWTGKLNDNELVAEMSKNNKSEENLKFLSLIKRESEVDTLFFYDVHTIKKREKIKTEKKKKDLLREIQKQGFSASDTHFLGTAIKTDMPYEKFIKLLN